MPLPKVDGPKVLGDPSDPLWSDRAGWLAFMAERGWTLPSAERMGVPATPERRRRAAVDGWARDHGITHDRWPSAPDRPRLRAMGL